MQWIHLITGAGAVQGLMLALYLFALARQQQHHALGWLGSFVLAFSLVLAIDVMMQTRALLDAPHLYQVFDFLILWLGPLLYGYVRLVLGLARWSWRQKLLHFAPGLAILLLLIPEMFVNAATKRLSIQRELAITGTSGPFDLFSTLLLFQVLAYWVAALWQIDRYSKSLEQQFSELERYRLQWLRQLLWICGPLWLFWAISIMTPWPSAVYLSQVGFAVSVYALGYRGMRQVQLWSDPEQSHSSAATPRVVLDTTETLAISIDPPSHATNGTAISEAPLTAGHARFESPATKPLLDSPALLAAPEARYAKSGLTAADLETIDANLDALMQRELCFLEPELSLTDLAKRLRVSAHALSQTLNMHRRQNFFEYINGLRVQEVKRCFVDPAYQNQSILEIALAAGFASKATFNATFKRLTGLTPSQARLG